MTNHYTLQVSIDSREHAGIIGGITATYTNSDRQRGTGPNEHLRIRVTDGCDVRRQILEVLQWLAVTAEVDAHDQAAADMFFGQHQLRLWPADEEPF